MGFAPAELAEMARADAEIEASFRVTDADLAIGRLFDREAILDRMDSKQKRRVEGQRLYLAFVHGPSFRDSSYKHFDIFGHKVEFWVFLLPERLTHLLIFDIFG